VIFPTTNFHCKIILFALRYKVKIIFNTKFILFVIIFTHHEVTISLLSWWRESVGASVGAATISGTHPYRHINSFT